MIREITIQGTVYPFIICPQSLLKLAQKKGHSSLRSITNKEVLAKITDPETLTVQDLSVLLFESMKVASYANGEKLNISQDDVSEAMDYQPNLLESFMATIGEVEEEDEDAQQQINQVVPGKEKTQQNN